LNIFEHITVAAFKLNFIRIGYIETVTCTCTQTVFCASQKKISWIKSRYIYERDVKVALSKITRIKNGARAFLWNKRQDTKMKISLFTNKQFIFYIMPIYVYL